MLPCPGCDRFIRSHADGCPFCGLSATKAPSPVGMMVASAVLGLALSACGSTGSGDEAGDDTSDTFEAAEVAAYGAPEVDTNLTQEDTIEPPDTTSSSGSSGSGSTGTGSTSADSGTSGDSGSGSSTSGSGSGGDGDSSSGTRGA